MVVWPLDRRYNNAHSRPFNGDGRGAVGVRSGEFYFTSPPPEYMRRSFSEAALAMVSRRPALSLVLAPLEVPHVPLGLWPVAGRHLRQAC